MEEVRTVENDEQMRKSYRLGLMKFFSVDSDLNLNYEAPVFPKSVCGKELIIKIVQVTVGCTCAGMYSEGAKVMTYSISSLTFPYVVFGSFIIITSIIILSYMLGYAMPDVLVRIFNTLATILYFISATLTIYVWSTQRNKRGGDLKVPFLFLLIQSITSYLNSFIYGVDAFLSYRKAIVFE